MVTMGSKAIAFVVLLGLATAYPQTKPGLKLISKLDSHNGNEESGLGIYKGKTTTIEKHPYLVGLTIEGWLYCAGVILSDSWIITDADCTNGYTKNNFTVVAASSDGAYGTNYNVKKIVTHPKFGSPKANNYYYAYALMEIEGSFTWGSKVGNISLPSKRLADNTELVVVGYGDTSSEDGTLMQGNMKLLPNAICSSYFENPIGWYKSEACAYNKGKTTICYSDFGDPFVYKGVLYGIALGGLSDGFCSSQALPAIMSDIYLVVDWIQKYTKAEIAQN